MRGISTPYPSNTGNQFSRRSMLISLESHAKSIEMHCATKNQSFEGNALVVCSPGRIKWDVIGSEPVWQGTKIESLRTPEVLQI